MGRLRFLWMACLFTLMFAAIEVPVTNVSALEKSGPRFNNLFSRLALVGALAVLLVVLVATQNHLLDLTTVAPSLYADFAGTAKPLVTRSLTKVLTAGHELATNLPAAPTAVIVSVETFPGLRFFAAKTELGWSHLSAWWTGSSMA